MTREEMRNKIMEKYPGAEFKIIETSGYVSKPITIKCLKCGENKTYTTFSSGLMGKSKKTFCTNCKRLAPTPLQAKATEIISKRDDLEFVKWIGRGTKGKILFKCLRCEKETDRTLHRFVTQERQNCAWCSSTARRKDQDLVYDFFKERDFEMLDPYEDAHTPIRFKHHCGFIFSSNPTNLSQRLNCPRCDNKHESAGSRLIGEYLDSRGLHYEKEKTFPWLKNNYRYDYYVPSLNLIVEFHGKQHYVETPFFVQARSFEEQQEADRIKESSAKKEGYNFLVIKYNEVKKITSILDSTTTSLRA